jgi:SCY1-like protein 2
MVLTKSLSTRIEQEHTRKLQEMSASNPTVSSRNDFMSFGGAAGYKTNGMDEAGGDTNDFEALVLGKKGGASGPPGTDSFDIWNKPSQIPSNHLPVRSKQNSPAPTFSWSTPSPSTAMPPPSIPPSIPSTQPLSSFGVLQPQPISTAMPSAFSQPLQPTINRPAPSTTNSATSTINWAAASSTNPWSTPSTPSTSAIPSSNAWSSNSSSIAPSNIWAASQPQLAPTSSYGQQQNPPSAMGQSSFTIAPPPASPYSNFGIAPPPAVNQSKPAAPIAGMQSRLQQQPTQPAQKQGGLDKWESLL